MFAQTSPFGRKVSPEAAADRDAPRGVQQSLFSRIRAAGYEGSAASSIAWKLIKAVRPAMKDSALSLSQVGECGADELAELRACVVACATTAANQAEPRQLLIGDIVAMLDGHVARASQPSQPSESRAVAGPTSAERAAERAAERRLEASSPEYAADLERFRAMPRDADGRSELRDSLLARTRAEVLASLD